ncbi:MAG: hypothetical protein LBT59_15435 [Clostridiales bacterium]|nr:hypothetical protein [Clostridiales bacterium]
MKKFSGRDKKIFELDILENIESQKKSAKACFDALFAFFIKSRIPSFASNAPLGELRRRR